MNQIPDVIVSEILSFLPTKSYLPICHVSKRFRSSWIHMKERQQSSTMPNSKCNDEGDATYHTYPLQVGNLFDTPWNAAPSSSNNSALNYNFKNSNNTLRTSLLEYYISCGWITQQQNNDCNKSKKNIKRLKKLPNLLLRRVLLEAAARGDIEGISFLSEKGLYSLQDDAKELCTVAGAAGRIEALRWLREERNCAWDAAEVHREASENSELTVMSYVEMNSGAHEIQMHYGEGLPW
mmetsp:Transcript_2385/g.3469  ORF Transcript_2385/g.3469 Transcript_2385/m.3469 type:complete len:237 (+) Transcript_2385:2228-2938(+)